MHTTRAMGGPGDKTLNRAIKALALLLLIGVPLIVFIYWSDRHVDAAPSLADRQITAAADAVRADPTSVTARTKLAAAYVSAKRYDEGIEQFGQVLKLEAGNRAALLGRGVAYVAQANLAAGGERANLDATVEGARLDAARADFQQVVDQGKDSEMAKSDPQLEQAYYELGVIALRQGRPADAVDVLTKALAIDSGDADALNVFGTALIQSGDPAKGVQALRRAVQFVPSGWCEPYQGMVDGYGKLANAEGVAYATAMVGYCGGKLDEAATQLGPLVGGSFKIDALLGLALVARDRGDVAASADYFKQVLAVDAQNASALIGLSGLGGPDAHAGIPALATPGPGSN